MIALYYTGALRALTGQTDPSKSLGGYISNMIVANDDLGNVFGDITQLMKANGSRDTFAIAIKNVAQTTLSQCKFWLTWNPAIADYKVAFVSPAYDDCGPYVELIPNSSALPINANWLSPSTSQTAADLGDLTSGQYLVVWISRTVVKQTSNSSICDDLNAQFVATGSISSEDQIDDVVINFSYT